MARFALFFVQFALCKIYFVGVPSVIPQGPSAPKTDGIDILDDFSNTPTALYPVADF